MVSSAPPFSQRCLQHCPHWSSLLSLLVFAVFFPHLITVVFTVVLFFVVVLQWERWQNSPAVKRVQMMRMCSSSHLTEPAGLLAYFCASLSLTNQGDEDSIKDCFNLDEAWVNRFQGCSCWDTHLSSIHFLNNSSDTWVYLLVNLCWETICGWLRCDTSFYRIVSVTPTAPHCSTTVTSEPSWQVQSWDAVETLITAPHQAVSHARLSVITPPHTHMHTHKHLWKVSLHWCWESLLMKDHAGALRYLTDWIYRNSGNKNSWRVSFAVLSGFPLVFALKPSTGITCEQWSWMKAQLLSAVHPSEMVQLQEGR